MTHIALKVSYFGDTLSHTYAAAVALTRDCGLSDCELTGCDTVYETLMQVIHGGCEMGVVPIENSFEGTVAATVDALGELDLFIARETVIKIKQSLIANRGVTFKNIKRVYSHPQALAQCRATLRTLLPQAVAISVAYTSAGLDMLDGESAAIARAPKAGQVALKENVADSDENCTRFLAVKKTAENSGDKVSVLFKTENKPGALLEVLDELRARGLNMIKIESRPAKKKMGQYVFYVDFMFTGGDAELEKLLITLRKKSTALQFLGRYCECRE